MSEDKILQLVYGPPAIAKVDFDTKTKKYILEDPLTIVYGQKENEKPRFSILELMMLSSDNIIEVMENNVIYSYTPLPEIIDQYNAMLLTRLIPIDD